MPPYGAILFDMDGVIMDSMEYHVLAWQEVFRELGHEIPREFILENEGSHDVDLWLQKLTGRGLGSHPTPVEAARASDFMRSLGRRQREIFLPKYSERVQPYSGAGPLLAALRKRNKPCALVTSSSKFTMQRIVPQNLKDCLTVIIAAEDTPRPKPNPDPYLLAAQQLNVAPHNCLVVENSPAGIKAGVAAGATCAGICSTLSPSWLCQANFVFASLEELSAHLGLA